MSTNFFSDDLIRVIVDSALAAVITMNDEGQVTGWGARASELFGWQPDEVLGKPLVDLIIPPRYREAHKAGLDHYRRTGEGRVLGNVLELAALHRNGREFPVEIRISQAAKVDGSTTFIAFLADITERRHAQQAAEAALRAEADRIAELESTKSKFLNLAAHELRGPLAVIRGYVSMLESGIIEVDKVASILGVQVARMSALVDQLLDAARFDEGRLELAQEPIDLIAVVADSVRSARLASHRKIEFESCPETVEVMGDPLRIGSIVGNLLDNGIKYSSEPTVVRCAVTKSERAATVTVSDRGLGIAEADLPTLFTRFGRIVTPENSHIGGTGLGLYLSREVARMHGGDITVSSVQGQGSTFELVLPLADTAGRPSR